MSELITPKEKAKQMFDRYMQVSDFGFNGYTETAKECALIAANFCLNEILSFDDGGKHFWSAVKTELERM